MPSRSPLNGPTKENLKPTVSDKKSRKRRRNRNRKKNKATMPAHSAPIMTPPASPSQSARPLDPTVAESERQLVRVAIQNLKERSAAILSSTTMKRVDAVVKENYSTLKPYIPETYEKVVIDTVGATVERASALGDKAVTTADAGLNFVDSTLRNRVLEPAAKIGEMAHEKTVAARALLKPEELTRLTEELKTQFGSTVQKTNEKMMSLYGAVLDQYATTKAKGASGLKEDVETFVAGVRAQMGEAYTARLDTPLREFYQNQMSPRVEQMNKASAKDLYLSSSSAVTAIQTIVSDRVTQSRELVNTRYQSILSKALDAISTVLPAEADDETPEQLSLVAVSSTASARVQKILKKSASSSMTSIRAFSKDRLQNILHVDLIQYTEEVINKTNATATQRYNQVQDQLASVSASAKDQYTTVVATAQTKSEPAVEAAKARYAELHERLQTAIAAAREQATGRGKQVYGTAEAYLESGLKVVRTPAVDRLLASAMDLQKNGMEKATVAKEGTVTYFTQLKASVVDAASNLKTVVVKNGDVLLSRPLLEIAKDAGAVAKQTAGLAEKDSKIETVVAPVKEVYTIFLSVLEVAVPTAVFSRFFSSSEEGVTTY